MARARARPCGRIVISGRIYCENISEIEQVERLPQDIQPNLFENPELASHAEINRGQARTRIQIPGQPWGPAAVSGARIIDNRARGTAIRRGHRSLPHPRRPVRKMPREFRNVNRVPDKPLPLIEIG